jgi:hypothetical protein
MTDAMRSLSTSEQPSLYQRITSQHASRAGRPAQPHHRALAHVDAKPCDRAGSLYARPAGSQCEPARQSRPLRGSGQRRFRGGDERRTLLKHEYNPCAPCGRGPRRCRPPFAQRAPADPAGSPRPGRRRCPSLRAQRALAGPVGGSPGDRRRSLRPRPGSRLISISWADRQLSASAGIDQ